MQRTYTPVDGYASNTFDTRLCTAMRGIMLLAALASGVSFAWATAPSGPWDTFNLAPATRVVRPTSVKKSHGSIKNGNALLTSSGQAIFSANESWLTLDFGKEVCRSHISTIGGWAYSTRRLEGLYP